MKTVRFEKLVGADVTIVISKVFAWEVRPAAPSAGIKEQHTAIFVGDCVFLVVGDQDDILTECVAR